MARLKVLVLAPKYRGVGGAEAYTRLLTRAVADGEAEVDVLSLLEGKATDQEVSGRYLGHQGSRPTVWAYARLVGEALRRGGRYDLVICSHVAVAPVGMILHQVFRTPYIVIGYGIDVWGHLRRQRYAALQRAARVIAVSKFTASMLTSLHGIPRDRVCVIHPLVDPALLALTGCAPSRTDGEPVSLLTVARLSAEERYKGCDTVIRALPAIQSALGPVRYVIVGDGDDRPRLETLAQHIGIAASITFRGHVTVEELAAQYRACDVFVMPSVADYRSDGWTGEGFGIVYIEAAAFGRPVVAGSGGGAPEALQDGVTGLVVDGSNVDAVASALIRLIKDKALRARMGEAGWQWVRQRFTFDRFQREVEAVVAAVVRGSSP